MVMTHLLEQMAPSGQRQRLLLARVFINDYDFLLLNEPTSALEKNTKQVVLDNLMEYGKNKTIIIVSHDTFEVCYDFEYWNLSENVTQRSGE